MNVELKIKSKHLALEPNIIRIEERKIKKQIKYTNGTDHSLIWKLQSLQHHRRWDVRNESRATHIARTFLAGKAYSYAERKRKPENEHVFTRMILPRVLTMVKKYGTIDQRKIEIDDLKLWSKL
jgi:hypothetical protein